MISEFIINSEILVFCTIPRIINQKKFKIVNLDFRSLLTTTKQRLKVGINISTTSETNFCFVLFGIFVLELKLMCPMHGSQTKSNSGLWRRKRFITRVTRERGSSCSKDPNSLVFSRVFKSNI